MPTSSGRARPTASASRTRSTSRRDARGQGLGRLLLAELLARCEAAGVRQLLAVIGDSANARLDRRAPRARLRAASACSRPRLEVRPLARRRADGEEPRSGATATPRRPPERRSPATARRPSPPGSPSLGGRLGLHRFYLHGARDRWAWLQPLPTLVGAYGVWRMRELGVDDRLGWLLVPLLGFDARRGDAARRSSTA